MFLSVVFSVEKNMTLNATLKSTNLCTLGWAIKIFHFSDLLPMHACMNVVLKSILLGGLSNSKVLNLKLNLKCIKKIQLLRWISKFSTIVIFLRFNLLYYSTADQLLWNIFFIEKVRHEISSGAVRNVWCFNIFVIPLILTFILKLFYM